MSETTLVMLKAPELGKAKTRLAQTIGEKSALKVYLRLLAHTDSITATATNRVVCLSGQRDLLPGFSGSNTAYITQIAGDLGMRLHAAVQSTFAQGSSAVVVLGADCAQLTTEHLQLAFNALTTHDVVLGPAYDGGYYLIGMKQPLAALFNEIDWSTNRVAAQTRAAIKDLDLSWTELEVLRDLDNIDDLRELGWHELE